MFATLPAPGLAHTFALVLDLLRRTAAAGLASNRAASPTMTQLWGYLHRVSARFASLLARIEAGTLRPPRSGRPQSERRPQGPRLPAGYGWLAQLVPEARVCASQLQYFLSQLDMVALLDAEPRFGRILRPLCRMLAVTTPAASSLSASPPQSTGATPTRKISQGTGPEQRPIAQDTSCRPHLCATPPAVSTQA